MLNWIAEELAGLDRTSMRRALRTGTASRLSFSSNDYLGLARHPEVIAVAQEAMSRWGAGAASSRLIRGTLAPHTALENELAAWLGTEAALVFPAGYMANLGVVTSLVGPGDAIVMDRLCHASMVDAARLSGARLFVYAHADAASAERALARTRSYRRRLLMTESLFSMDGDVAPLADLLALGRRYKAMTMVDEAHALGVFGEEGRGMTSPPLHPSTSLHPDVIVGTLSKALGSQGGFVAGSRTLVDWLVNRARPFIFTTGLAPANAAAASAALRIARSTDDRRAQVRKLSEHLRHGLQQQGWNTLQSAGQIIPVVTGEAEPTLALAKRLEDSGIDAPAIRPPTVHAGECRIRLSVTTEHTEEDISKLLAAVQSVPSPMPRTAGAREREVRDRSHQSNA